MSRGIEASTTQCLICIIEAVVRIINIIIIIIIIAEMAVFNVAGYLIEERRRWRVITFFLLFFIQRRSLDEWLHTQSGS